jgi:hypothetical protein
MGKALESSRNRRSYVVTVHGVGGPSPGGTLRGLAEHFATVTNRDAPYVAADQVIEGASYRCMTSDAPEAPTLLEVNWSDIRQPPKSPLSELWHVPKLLVGMLHLADRWDGVALRRRWPLTLYKLLIESSVWGVPYVVYVMLLASASQSLRPLVAVSFSLAVFLLAWSVWIWSHTLTLFGVVASFAYLCVGLSAQSSQAMESVIRSASAGYVIRHQSFPIVIYALFVVVLLLERRRLTIDQRLTRFALAYLPFLGLAIAGALLWIITIPLVSNTAGYGAWSKIHAQVLIEHRYDLRLSEYSHLAGILILGISTLLVASVYGLRVLTGRGRETSGSFCRNAIPILASLVPVSLVPVSFAIIYAIFHATAASPRDVLEVYRISALRVVPFLPWMLTPMRIVVDVAGDVVFTALPADEPLSIARRVTNRIEIAIRHVAKEAGRVVVLSHSLGTVLAALAPKSVHANLTLITTGSPITALHQRFLGIDVSAAYRGERLPWINIFRGDDYVGGSVVASVPVENVMQPEGGHTGYWTDDHVLARVEDALLPKNDVVHTQMT